MLTIAIALAMAGCAGPTRTTEPEAFKLLQSGKVPVADVQRFTECLTDGFGDAHPFLATLSTRQQRRSDGYRVETVHQGSIYVSADARDDGVVELRESRIAGMLNTTGERRAFTECLARFSRP